MPGSADAVRAMAEKMLDEELALILDRMGDRDAPSLFQNVVVAEAERRGLAPAQA